MDTTEVTSPTPDGQGTNQGETEGTATPASQEARTFSQTDIDKLMGKTRSEERSKFEKELQAKIAEREAAIKAELDTVIEQRVQEKLAAQASTDALELAKSTYGLSDEQVAALPQTGTPDEIAAKAESLFGALLVRKPPVINPGIGTSAGPVKLEDMSGQDIIKNWDALWRQHAPKQ